MIVLYVFFYHNKRSTCVVTRRSNENTERILQLIEHMFPPSPPTFSANRRTTETPRPCSRCLRPCSR
jgi:hypothetical protein